MILSAEVPRGRVGHGRAAGQREGVNRAPVSVTALGKPRADRLVIDRIIKSSKMLAFLNAHFPNL